jgi:hypothetical protein
MVPFFGKIIILTLLISRQMKGDFVADRFL